MTIPLSGGPGYIQAMRRLIAALLLALPCIAEAQYPAKPIRYIVPFPPGAFNDTLGRIIAAELPKAD